MLKCPTCTKNAVPVFDAWSSKNSSSVECTQCGARSYVRSTISGVPFIVALMIALAGGFFAAWLHNEAVFWIAIAVAGIAYVRFWQRMRLTPFDSASAPVNTSGRFIVIAEVIAILASWR